MSDCFSKPVNAANHWNYLYSAYLSDKFFNTIHEGKIDAIYYPSVPDKLNSENLAIKPKAFDRIYKLAKVEESIIIQDPSDGHGGYGMQVTRDCENFNFETNEIMWDEIKHNIPKNEFEYFKINYGLDLD